MRAWIGIAILLAGTGAAAACGDSGNTSSASTGGSGGQSNTGGDATGGTHEGGGTTGGGGQGGTSQGGSSQGGSTQGGGGSGGTGGTGGADLGCPGSPVMLHEACATPGQWCSWGEDPRYGCRISAMCQDNHKWDRYPVSGTYNCPGAPACPSDVGATDCTQDQMGLVCVGTDGTPYTCTICNGNLCFPDPKWISSDVLDPKCPMQELPNLGSPCKDEGLGCDYDHCADDQSMTDNWAHGIALTCKNGFWTVFDTMTFCP